MNISVQDIHIDTIKPFDNGEWESVVYSVTHKVMIHDTAFRSFIPPQAHKITPKLHHISGCELCTIPKDKQTDLNIFRTIFIIYLQQKSDWRHTHNSLFCTTSAALEEDRLFTDDDFSHAKIKDAAQCITCFPIKYIYI